MTFLLVPLFALFYRLRGGGFVSLHSTQLARLVFWAAPVGVYTAVFFSIELAPIVALLAFLGLLAPHAKFQMLDSNFIGMGAITFARCVLLLFPLTMYLGLNAAALVGLSFVSGTGSAVGYWAGWKFLHDKNIIGFDGAAWGEVFTGAAFGIVFATIATLA